MLKFEKLSGVMKAETSIEGFYVIIFPLIFNNEEWVEVYLGNHERFVLMRMFAVENDMTEEELSKLIEANLPSRVELYFKRHF